MAKLTVIKEPKGNRVPFLKGILVQSLLSAGLSFKEAYDVTRTIRKSLENTEAVSTAELKATVAALIHKEFGKEARSNYEAGLERKQDIMVHSERGERRFSIEILSRSLEACALDSASSHKVADIVEETVRSNGFSTIDSSELQGFVYRALKKHAPKKIAKYYLSRIQFKKSGDPLIILIGGATGTGKSTITTELAYRLNILRTQSTDVMREIIRSYLAPHMVPTLGYSSFEAWRGLPTESTPANREATNSRVIDGFLNQFTNVKPALQATIARTAKERLDIIIEGIHLLPELDLTVASEKALVIPVMLAVTNKQRLAEHIAWRSREQPDRGSARYLEQLEAIWELQSFLLSKADEAGIPIIANWSMKDTVWDVLQEVNRKINKRYPPDPGLLR